MTFNDAIDITLLDRFLTNLKNLFAKKTEVPTATSDLVNDSVLFPNFDNLTPIKTIEFDKSTSGYNILLTRANTNISSTMDEVQDVVLFRITVTGTNIYSRSDVLLKFQPGINTAIQGYAFHHTLSTSAATTGIQYLRLCWPKAANNNYNWLVDFAQYNATTRHYKIEVFATTDNITWNESLVNTTYNSTYQTGGTITLYTSRGLVSYPSIPISIGGNANAASYINSYLPEYISSTPIRAGEALVAYDIAFINNGFAYKIGNKNVEIEPEYGIRSIGTTFAINANISYTYLRSIWSFTFTSAANHGLSYDSFVQGDNVYLRCTMKDGKIYSDAHLAKEMTPGYTWYLLGAAHNTTNGLAMNTTGSMFITLDDSGCISHINGKPTNATVLTEGVDYKNTFIKKNAVGGNAEVKKIGGNSIVWNSSFKKAGTYNGFVWDEHGGVTINLTTTTAQTYYASLNNPVYVPIIIGHVYYSCINFLSGTIEGSLKVTQYIFNHAAVDVVNYGTISKVIATSNKSYPYIWSIGANTTLTDVKLQHTLIDLTRMFGAGREPATAEEVEALFPDDYYEYNEGELLSLSMTGLKTTKSAGGTLSTLPLNVTTITGKAEGSNESVVIFPDGMNGIGSVQDEIDFESGKAVKRIGSVDLGSFSWLRTSSGSMYYFYFNGTSFDWIVPSSDDDIKRQSILCDKYSVTTTLTSAISTTLTSDKTIVMRAQGSPAIRDDSYEDAASFKTAVTGTKMLFELAEPIEYTLDTIPNRSYRVEKGGKEIILPEANNDVVTAPATIVSHYGTNIIKALQDLEDGVVFAGDDDGEGVIAEGGDVNVIETVKVNGTALTPDANKAVNVIVPTTLSGLASDTTHRTVTDTEKSTWSGKQDALVSGTNIKTINNESILGSGNITIQGGSGGSGDENVIETVKVNGTALTPDANKAVNITVPTPYIMEFSGSGSSVTIEEHAYETLSNAISEERDVYLKKGSYLYALNVYGEDYLYFTHTSGEELFIESVVVYSDDTAESFLNFLRSAYIGGSDVALGAGDKLIITDASHNNYISRSPITFDGSTTTKALTPKGTWETFLQSYTETDPTVPAWAKASTKPSYTASEVGALPSTTVIPAAPGTLNTTATTAQSTSPSEALSGSITLHKVAKTGTYNDLIGKPTIPTVPTNVSAFTNDAGYLTSASVVTIYSGSTAPSSSLGNNGDIYIKTS